VSHSSAIHHGYSRKDVVPVAKHKINAGVRHGNDEIDSLASVFFSQKLRQSSLSILTGEKIQVKAFTQEGDLRLVGFIECGFYRVVDRSIGRGGPAFFGKENQDLLGIRSVTVTGMENANAGRQQAGKSDSCEYAWYQLGTHAEKPFLQISCRGYYFFLTKTTSNRWPMAAWK
jgi:hypothetical protein